MKTWYVRGTPPHPTTDLTLVVTHEGGRYGRTRVQAFDAKKGLVHTAIYEWSKWEGHCSGHMLMPEFVAASEKARNAGVALPQTPVAEVRAAMVMGEVTTKICPLVDAGTLPAGTLLYAHPAGVAPCQGGRDA